MVFSGNRTKVKGSGLRLAAVPLLLSVSAVALSQVALAQTTTTPPAQKTNKQQQPAPPKQAANAPAAPSREEKAGAITAPSAAPAARRAGDGDIVARAGDKELTAKEVRSFVAGLPVADQAALARDPALFSQTLRMMLANQLVLKEALAKKWDQDPTFLAQLQRLRDNAIVESYLQSVSVPSDDYPSAGEVEKAYEANKAALAVPPQFLVAQIYVSGSDKAAAEKKLAEVQAQLGAANADFAAIAKAQSDERASAERGGEIGWLTEEQLRPEIRTHVTALTKGAVSAPIQAADGWHFLKLLDTKLATTRTLAEVKGLLAQRLRTQRAEINRRAQLARLLEQSPPTINELALSTVLDQPRAEAKAE